MRGAVLTQIPVAVPHSGVMIKVTSVLTALVKRDASVMTKKSVVLERSATHREIKILRMTSALSVSVPKDVPVQKTRIVEALPFDVVGNDVWTVLAKRDAPVVNKTCVIPP